MKNIAFGSGALVLVLTSLAFAKDEPKTAQAEPKKAAPPAAAPAPAAAAEKKAAPAAQPAPADKAAAPAMKPAQPVPAPPAPAPAPAPATPPAPAPEIAEVFKAVGGTWKCTGTMTDPVTNAAKPSVSTMTVKMDNSLDKYWIVSTFAEKKSKETPTPFKFTAYRTFNAKTKKWTSIMVDNMGMDNKSTSAGPVNGVVTWDSQGEWEGKKFVMKDVETTKGPKEVHMKGDFSMDNGKTWMPMYEVTCKK
jgi:hypothetical protein